MRDLAYQFGSRLKPADPLVELEETGATVHDAYPSATFSR
jgi:hypothetical protein